MRWMPRAALALALALASRPSPAEDRVKPVVSRADDLPVALLARLCARGMVALIEPTPDGSSRQVVLFAHLPVPPERIYDALMDVEAYPSFLSSLDDVYVTGRKNGIIGFSWTLDLPFFALRGTRLQRGLRPRLIESRGRTGHLRGTRERWELYPAAGGTLVAFYRALDIETGGFLLRTLVDMEPSMEAGANISSGFIHLRGLQRHVTGRRPAERLPQTRTGTVPPFVPLDLQSEAPLDALRPLLAHGQLALIESYDDGALRQVALLSLARVGAPAVRAVVTAPAQYPDFMPNISRQEVTRRADGQLEMAWTIKTPVSAISGTALMTLRPDGVEINALSGDVPRARMLWRFLPVDEERSVVVYYTYSDIRSASWVTRLLLDAEPLLEHGMVGAAATVALTAMTARAEGRR